jgi:hypothetical protein
VGRLVTLVVRREREYSAAMLHFHSHHHESHASYLLECHRDQGSSVDGQQPVAAGDPASGYR